MGPRFLYRNVSYIIFTLLVCTSFSPHNCLNELVLQESDVVKTYAGIKYRDLNNNGQLDIYEDCTKPIKLRINDLISQMSLEEKAGMMFINGVSVNFDGSLNLASTPSIFNFFFYAPEMILNQKMNAFNYYNPIPIASVATWNNNIQRFAESTRLGIPVTIASDPRHHIKGAGLATFDEYFSQWCDPLGFAAIGDPGFLKGFMDIARKDYLAVGIREALHPQIDLATEPRWSRISGTFGEDLSLTKKLLTPYIKGFQGNSIGPNSVACMVKHFPGGGSQNEGLDPHFDYQLGQVYPGNNFDFHLEAFVEALKSNPSAVMPYYGVPIDQGYDEIGFAYNKDIITGLLRDQYNFDGIICTDWGLVTDLSIGGTVFAPARAWGVESLSPEQRVKKLLDAGIDQLGGESVPEHIINLVNNNEISISRIDSSVRKLLNQKFELGLFDNPFVDEVNAQLIVNTNQHKELGELSQTKAMTLLKNQDLVLPLEDQNLNIYIENIDPTVAGEYATVVNTPGEADFAIIRIETPSEIIPNVWSFTAQFPHGDLDFKDPEKTHILNLLNSVPTIVDIWLERPAVIPEIAEKAKALVANFGATDKAVLDVIFGKASPEGKLPFELPSSMEAVLAQAEDLPYDSMDPLFPFGFGLEYSNNNNSIPTLSHWCLYILTLCLSIFGMIFIKQREISSFNSLGNEFRQK